MLANCRDVLSVVTEIYQGREWPRQLRLLTIPDLRAAGREVSDVARELRTTQARVREIAGSADPIAAVLRTPLSACEDEARITKAKQGLGQMLLGTLSERAFEKLYKDKMGTTELRLEDTREGGTDTDYRVYNGSGKAVFRINIKFHGSPFRNARELVGLEPEDCFALATYKINQAIRRQESEFLPYVFVIVGVPGLRGEAVGARLPGRLVRFAALVLASGLEGKRSIEDAIVRHLVDDEQPAEVRAVIAEIAAQLMVRPWLVLSARRADRLLREQLFERVFALRVRAFTSHYRRAEVDMHFSLTHDLRTLEYFLDALREHGLQGVVLRLERGDI